jgi:hypothetical protein
MTHDELRDYIDKFDAAGMVKEPAVAALRAVVELHKPEFVELIQDLGCMACRHGAPCPTIQAIEKELDSAAI